MMTDVSMWMMTHLALDWMKSMTHACFAVVARLLLPTSEKWASGDRDH